jgi:hypothetical protein
MKYYQSRKKYWRKDEEKGHNEKKKHGRTSAWICYAQGTGEKGRNAKTIRVQWLKL